MKNTFSPFTKLIAIAACALSLGSCNRAEYAMLPKGGSYHGVSRAATPVPAPAQRSVVQEAPAPVEAMASETKAAAVSQKSANTVAVATPAAATKHVAAAPAAPAAASNDEAAAAVASVATLPQSARKLTRVQKFAASRVGRIASEVAGISQFKRSMETAKTERIGGNLRTGIILLLVGLLITLLSGISRLFGVVGTIIAVIGLVFIVLWLLDSL